MKIQNEFSDQRRRIYQIKATLFVLLTVVLFVLPFLIPAEGIQKIAVFVYAWATGILSATYSFHLSDKAMP
ncbi:MAG: hypothetical protein KBC98_00705 [Candidatus Pacebacteria bacterium]|nr:hypothetical protein [Candidatus Paceibacterota bacterium]